MSLGLRHRRSRMATPAWRSIHAGQPESSCASSRAMRSSVTSVSSDDPAFAIRPPGTPGATLCVDAVITAVLRRRRHGRYRRRLRLCASWARGFSAGASSVSAHPAAAAFKATVDDALSWLDEPGTRPAAVAAAVRGGRSVAARARVVVRRGVGVDVERSEDVVAAGGRVLERPGLPRGRLGRDALAQALRVVDVAPRSRESLSAAREGRDGIDRLRREPPRAAATGVARIVTGGAVDVIFVPRAVPARLGSGRARSHRGGPPSRVVTGGP